MATKIIVCLDGTGPDYIEKSDTPNLDAVSKEGFRTIGTAIVPTVTNVNNTTIVTASFPETHGITTNYYFDPVEKKEVYMESSEFLLKETMFRRLTHQGKKSVLFTAKDKLKTLIQDGASIAESAEKPSRRLVDRIGPPPDIYTIEVNHWLFRAALSVLMEEPPDLLYVTTTDYVTHTYCPEDEKSLWNMHEVDRLIGEMINAASDIELILTADHGMNPKSRGLDLNKILKGAGITANAIPIIKDRHVVHHKNLGGAAYVYLDAPADTLEDAMALLREEKGIEAVMPNNEAAHRYHLHPSRIGHIFVLADKDTVFGALPHARENVKVRSHGSLHERDIPIFGYGPGPLSAMPKSNHQVTDWIF